MWRLSVAGLVLCWLGLLFMGDFLQIRHFLIALGGILAATIHLSVRGPGWWIAFRLGQRVHIEGRGSARDI